MITHLLSVTNLELLAGQVVKILATLALLTGAVISLIKAFRAKSVISKIGRIAIAGCLLFLATMVIKWLIIEGDLLRSKEYTIGTTMSLCQVFVRGEGIEFEYSVGGEIYRNCNTSHPIPISEITVPNGQYSVRYSTRFPDKGRMDFTNSVE